MPRYYALDTAIKLSVWDPQTGPDLKLDNDRGGGKSNASVAAASMKHNGILRPNKIEGTGPAIGYVIDDLKEEYFEGHEGIDFVAPGMPFFLVKAGRELFAADEKEDDAGRQSSRGAKGATLTTAPATVLSNDIPNPAQSSRTSFSSFQAESLMPNGGSFIAPEQDESSKDTETSDEPAASTLEPSKASRDLRNEAVVKPITSPKPITVTVDLSPKSFIPSIYTSQRQELCITIFYNGELTHSRILRGNTLNSLIGPVHDEKYQYYSGRRIDSVFEVPWMVRPHSVIAGAEVESSGFSERWNKTNELLLAEANEWGYYNRFRSPMGEYLEALSKRAVPECMTNTAGRGEAGIVDVVITLGRSVAAGAICGLREPRRKLHADHCGKNRQLVIAPEELKPSRNAKVTREFNNETSRPVSSPFSIAESRRGVEGLFRKGGGSTPSTNAVVSESRISGNRPGYTMPQSTTAQTPPIPSVLDDHNQDGPSEPFPYFVDVPLRQSPHLRNSDILNRSKAYKSIEQVSHLSTANEVTAPSVGTTRMPPPSRSRRLSVPEPSSSPLTHYRDLSKSCPVTMMPVQKHPRKPKNIPQKRFRGAECPESGSSLKRRKLLNGLENVPFDPEKPASASTRSKRAVRSPAAPSPERFSSVAPSDLSLNGYHVTPWPKTTTNPKAGSSNLIPTNGTEVMAGNEHGTKLSLVDPSLNPGEETAESSNPAPQNPGSVNSGPDSIDMAQASTPITARRLFSVAELTALESDKPSHGQRSDSHTASHSMPFGLDGTPRGRIRVEQKATTTSWVQTNKFVTENHTSVRKRREAEIAKQNAGALTGITAKSSVSSDIVPPSKRRRKPAPPGNGINSGPCASTAARTSGIPAGKVLTGDKALHLPRSRAKIERVEGKSVGTVQAATSEVGSTGEKTIVPALQGAAEDASFNLPSEPTVDRESMGGKTIELPPAPPYKPVKRNKPKSTGSATKVSNASQVRGNIGTPSTTKAKAKRNSVSSTKQSNVTTETSENVEVPPNTQQKLKRNSVSSRKRGNTMSDGADHTKIFPTGDAKPAKPSAPHRKQIGETSDGADTIIPPHKGTSEVDTSFDSSFNEASNETQSSQNLKPVYAPPNMLDLANNSTKGGTETASITGSAQDGIVATSLTLPRKTPVLSPLLDSSHSNPEEQGNKSITTSRKSIGSSNTPSFPNQSANSSQTTEGQVDKATARLIQDAIRTETKPTGGLAQTKPNDTEKSKLLKAHIWQAAAAPIPSIQAESEKSNGLKPTEQVAIGTSRPAPEANDILGQATLARRPSRSYSVDSEGKKIPTPRIDCLEVPVASPQGQPEEAPSIQKPLQVALFRRRSSLSKKVPGTPKTSTAPRKMPATITPQQHTKRLGLSSAANTPNPKISISDTIAFSSSGVSTAPRRKLPATLRPQIGDNSRAKVAVAAPAKPKMSISDTITFSTRARAAQTPMSINTPASQSKSRTKRKALEPSAFSEDGSSVSSQLWKPNSLCDDSVLTYARSEKWPGTNIDPALKHVCRRINAEREGIFRASGVLMGVRFVVGLL